MVASARPYHARLLGLHGAHQAVGKGVGLDVALGCVMHRAGITAGRVIFELNGIGLACGNLFRTDNRARASHVVVGIAHLVAVKVGSLHRHRPFVVVGGGRGVAVGVFYVCDEHVEHVVVSVVVAHALPLVVLGLGEARQVAVGIVGHVVDRRLCTVV